MFNKNRDPAILNSANFSSITTDAKGVIRVFNVGVERMPGYKAADVMNKILPAYITVLALTANAMPRDIRKGMEAGFFSYITKPVKVHEFMEALNMALEFVVTESDGAINT